MPIKSQKDFVSGLMFAATGVAFAVGAREYEVGKAASMGPGYFPMLLGYILAVLGVVIALKAFGRECDEGEVVKEIAWRPLIFIVGANVVFGGLLAGVPILGLPPMGLAIAIVAVVFLASLAGQEFNAREVAILSLVLAVGSYLVFIILLKLPVSLWPTLAGN